MKKKVFFNFARNRYLCAAVAFAAALLVCACSSGGGGLGGDNGDKTTFSITIPKSITIPGGSSSVNNYSSRTVLDDQGVQIEDVDLTIKLFNGPGPDQTRTGVNTGETVSFTVAVGSWEFSIEAYKDGSLVAEGSQVMDVKSGQSNTVGIKMYPPIQDGSLKYPFLVSDAAALAKVGTGNGGWGLDKHYRLTTDISLSGSWTPIGINSDHPFRGTFNGYGKTISGLNINSGAENQGLFGYVGGGTVRNLTVKGSVTDYTMVGGVVGTNDGGTISNCYVAGSITGTLVIGGVVGHNEGIVSNCYTTGNITGGSGNTGGVVGQNKGTVLNCYATGDVTSGGSSNSGGVVGTNDSGTVQSCVALNGSVSGGSVGRVAGYDSGSMTNNFARNDMTTPSYPSPNINGVDGADVSASGPGGYNSESFWNGLGFTAANGWKWSGSRPTL